MIWWTLRKLKSSNWLAREAAARELGTAGKRQAVPRLIDALADETPQVRLAAAQALGRLRHPAAAEALAQALLRAAAAPPGNDECLALASALGGLGSPAAGPLIQLLQAKEKEARRWAAFALGQAADARAVEPLVERLGDSRSDVRKEAAKALGKIGEPRAVESLAAALTHKDPDTRRAAAEALGATGAASAVYPLAAAAADSTEAVQLAAIQALARIGGLEALQAVRSVLDAAGRKTVRESASAALLAMAVNPADAGERARAAVLKGDFAAAVREGAGAVPAILEAAGSRDPRRREEAARALGSVPATEGIEALGRLLRDPDPGVRAACAAALEAIGSPADSVLQALLESPDPGVQAHAARVLGRLRCAASAGALARMIRSNRSAASDYPDPLEAARAAAEALTTLAEASAPKIATADLQEAAAVPDCILTAGATHSISVDCSRLRALAAGELARRGVPG